MTQQELEDKIKELKTKQSDYFKQKKATRNPEEITVVREELNALKAQAGELYRGKK